MYYRTNRDDADDDEYNDNTHLTAIFHDNPGKPVPQCFHGGEDWWMWSIILHHHGNILAFSEIFTVKSFQNLTVKILKIGSLFAMLL